MHGWEDPENADLNDPCFPLVVLAEAENVVLSTWEMYLCYLKIYKFLLCVLNQGSQTTLKLQNVTFLIA